jgi:hypothetical protein
MKEVSVSPMAEERRRNIGLNRQDDRGAIGLEHALAELRGCRVMAEGKPTRFDLGGDGPIGGEQSIRPRPNLMADVNDCVRKLSSNNLVNAVPKHPVAEPEGMQRVLNVQISFGKEPQATHADDEIPELACPDDRPASRLALSPRIL